LITPREAAVVEAKASEQEDAGGGGRVHASVSGGEHEKICSESPAVRG